MDTDLDVRSPYADVAPPQSAHVAEEVLDRCKSWPERVAVVNIATGDSLTYGDLTDIAYARAAELRTKLGDQLGAVIGLWAPNDVEYQAIVYAVALVGGAVMPLLDTATDGEVERQLRDASALVLMLHTSLHERGRPLGRRVGAQVIVFGDEPSPKLPADQAGFALSGSSPRTSVGGGQPLQDAAESQDTFALLNGSATAGLPKPVALRHTDVVVKLAELEPAEGRFFGDAEVTLLLAPLSRSFGALMGLAFLPHKGATTLLWPAPRGRLDCELVLAAMEKYKVSTLYLPPSSLRQLVGFPGLTPSNTASLRRVVTFGARLPPELQLQAAELLGCVVKQIYGVTEASAVVAVAPDDAVKAGSGAAGPLLPNLVARVVDPATNGPVPRGVTGELLIGGNGLMAGYWVNERATAAVVGEDGFVRTGDIARFDEDGYLYIMGRSKDVIITSSGLPVSPAELESLLLLHPEVDDVCVLGKPVPDSEGGSGEDPMACVVPMEIDDAGPELKASLLAFVEERAAPHKQLTGGVIFVKSIPYNGPLLDRNSLKTKLVQAGVL